MFAQKSLTVLLFTALFLHCSKESAIPDTDYVAVKFVNNTGKNLIGLVVNQAEIGDIPKGKATRDYFYYQSLGQQYGYALVEAVAFIDGNFYSTASVCQGECGTQTAPKGVWLTPGYYHISVHLSKTEPFAMEFRVY